MERKNPLSNEKILELTKKAFDNKEIAEFLSGEKDYDCPVNRFVPANIPTDWNVIIEAGLYALYKETNNKDIVTAYMDGIIKLINSKNPIHVWIGYNVCWSQLFKEKRGKSPFVIITPQLIDLIRSALQKNKADLCLIQEWQGVGRENGLWGDIIRSNNTMKKDYGVSFL